MKIPIQYPYHLTAAPNRHLQLWYFLWLLKGFIPIGHALHEYGVGRSILHAWSLT